MATSNEQTLKEVISELLSAYKLEDKLKEVKLINSWETVLGNPVSKYTANIYIQKQTLFVELTSPALKQELSYAKSKLIDLLNNEAGHVVINEIVFL